MVHDEDHLPQDFEKLLIQAFAIACDGRGPSSTSHERQEPSQERLEPSQEGLGPREERLGPITRSMAKKIHEDLDQATDGRESYLYMLHEGPSRVA